MSFLRKMMSLMVRCVSMMCLLITLYMCLKVGSPSLTWLSNFGASHLLHIFLASCFTNGCLKFILIIQKCSYGIHLPWFKVPQMFSGLTFRQIQSVSGLYSVTSWMMMHYTTVDWIKFLSRLSEICIFCSQGSFYFTIQLAKSIASWNNVLFFKLPS